MVSRSYSRLRCPRTWRFCSNCYKRKAEAIAYLDLEDPLSLAELVIETTSAVVRTADGAGLSKAVPPKTDAADEEWRLEIRSGPHKRRQRGTRQGGRRRVIRRF